MKTILLLFLTAVIGTGVFAQSSAKLANEKPQRAGDPIPGVGVNLVTKAGVFVQQVQTDAQGNAVFSNVATGHYLVTIVSPRDVATAQASGKNATIHTVASPRDVATGQASGKREAANAKAGADTGEKNENEVRAGVSTSRSNVRTKKAVAAEVLVHGDDDTPNNGQAAKNQAEAEPSYNLMITHVATNAKAVINTSRSNIKTQRLMKSGDNVEVEVGADGQLICNVLKTKHDTVKNSISNIR